MSDDDAIRRLEPLLRLAERLPEVALGYCTLRLFSRAEIGDAQLGYGVGPDGEDLTGDGPADWRPSWWVVAIEDELGDPVFADTADPALPVLTAMHGEGDWEPVCIAASAAAFADALTRVAELSRGRDSPVALERTPVPEPDVEQVVRAATAGDPRVQPDFWRSWLSTP